MHSDERAIEISVVCPFFNEGRIIEQAVTTLLGKLDELDCNWELIVVNDGSRDGSEKIVEGLTDRHPRLRLVT